MNDDKTNTDDWFDSNYVSSFGSVFKKRADEDYKIFDAAALEALKALAEQAITTMATVPCLGDRDNLHACTWSIEAKCEKRNFNSCPREIIKAESLIKTLKAGDNTEVKQLASMGVPLPIAEHLISGTFEDNVEAMHVADEWWSAKPRPRVLVMFGSPGSGKTFAASYLLWRNHGRMVRASEMIAHAKAPDYLQSLRFVGLLAIDDIGTEPLDGFDTAKSIIGETICQRADAGLFTILPTNISPSALRERYGDRVANRIRTLGSIKSVTGSLRKLESL